MKKIKNKQKNKVDITLIAQYKSFGNFYLGIKEFFKEKWGNI